MRDGKAQLQKDLAAVAEIAARTVVTPAALQETSELPRTYHHPAKIAGADAVRKLKEQETQAIADRREQQEMYLAMFSSLPESAKNAAEARHTMITACQTFLDEGGFKGRVKDGRQRWNTKGVNTFCQAFMDGTLELPAEIAANFTRKGARSLTQAILLIWRDTYKEQGLYGLADHYASKAGATSLTTAQQNFVIGMIYEFPHVMPTKVYKGLKTRFKGEEIPTRHTVGRFMKHWKTTHASLYLFITNPDAWRSKHMFAFGSASEQIVRLNQRWEADSTPADLLCTDGRCAVIGIIDVWSRRLKLHVSPTSKSAAIAALFRRCLISWGVLEEFRTDCGTDYTSFHVERVCDALDVVHHLCNEFHPEEKPHIERAFKTFSHGLVELLPGYVGHSVADRKNIEARKSFASRLMTKGETLEVRLTMAELQKICDQWCETIYHQDAHSGLDGMTPAAKARSWTEPIARITNDRALDILLYPAPSNDGLRKIGKKGVEVTFNGVKLYYKAGEFAGHEGEQVRVLIDETDLGRAPIFRENGDFLALAEDPHWLGISSQEVAQKSKQKQKQVLAEQRQEIKVIAKQADTRNIATEILKDRAEQAVKITEFPKKSDEYSTPALDQAAAAVAERDRKTAFAGGTPITPDVMRKSEELIRRIPVQPKTGIERVFEIEKKMESGTATAEEIRYAKEWQEIESGPMRIRKAG
ncbi:MAG: transposase [Desulfuromonadales bacterium]|nr:transposase [Desulfuromonadales bacterium]